MKKTFLLILGIIILLALPLGVNAMPVCDCKSTDPDCSSGLFCVVQMGSYNPCSTPDPNPNGYDAHCMLCIEQGGLPYYSDQCGEDQCTYGTTTNGHCCASGEEWNGDSCEEPMPESCYDAGSNWAERHQWCKDQSLGQYCCGSGASSHCENCCNNNDCGICKMCDTTGANWICEDAAAGTDPKNNCAVGSWSCVNICLRGQQSGDCDGSGACDVEQDYIDAGYGCSGGSQVTNSYCDATLRCVAAKGDGYYGASYIAPAPYKCRGLCDGAGNCDYAGDVNGNECEVACGNGNCDCGETGSSCETDCISPAHKECSGTTCTIVSGPGTDLYWVLIGTHPIFHASVAFP